MDKRIFEQPLNDDPDSSMRIPVGKAGTTTENWLISKLYAKLNTLYANIVHSHAQYALATDIPVVSSGSISLVHLDCSMLYYSLKKYGSIVSFSGRFSRTSEDAPNVYTQLCFLPVGFRPSYIVTPAPMSVNHNEVTEGGSIYVTDGGNVYMTCGKVDQTWNFNLTWMI